MSQRFKPEERRTLDELLEIEDRMNGTAEGDFWELESAEQAFSVRRVTDRSSTELRPNISAEND